MFSNFLVEPSARSTLTTVYEPAPAISFHSRDTFFLSASAFFQLMGVELMKFPFNSAPLASFLKSGNYPDTKNGPACTGPFG